MKRWLLVLLLPVCLLGCARQETLETVSDVYLQPAAVSPRQITLELPTTAAVSVMETEQEERLYFCDGYTVCLQTLEAGDLSRTLQAATGYAKENLHLMETSPGAYKRYDCAWTTTGETEAQVGRTAVLDDGSYHYVLTCMTDESKAQSLQDAWNGIFRSFTLDTAQ